MSAYSGGRTERRAWFAVPGAFSGRWRGARGLLAGLIAVLALGLIAPAGASSHPVQTGPGGDACELGNPQLGENLTVGRFEPGPTEAHWYELAVGQGETVQLRVNQVSQPNNAFEHVIFALHEWDGDQECTRIAVVNRTVVDQAADLVTGGQAELPPLGEGTYQLRVLSGGSEIHNVPNPTHQVYTIAIES